MTRPHRGTVADRTASLVPVLAGAGTVAFGVVGFAGTTSPETTAYRELLAAGPGARPHPEWLLAHASPAGRAYAAHLLATWDAEAGREAWAWLAQQDGVVETMSGCMLDSLLLADYAARQSGSVPNGPVG